MGTSPGRPDASAYLRHCSPLGGAFNLLTDGQAAEVCAATATHGARTGRSIYEWHGGGTNGGALCTNCVRRADTIGLLPALGAPGRRSLLRCEMVPTARAASGRRAGDRGHA